MSEELDVSRDGVWPGECDDGSGEQGSQEPASAVQVCSEEAGLGREDGEPWWGLLVNL